MEGHIIAALALTVIILIFSLIRQSKNVKRLKRLEPEVVRLQTRLSTEVHKAITSTSNVKNLEADVKRLQVALSKEKQYRGELRAKIMRLQNEQQPFANFNQPPPEIDYTDPYWKRLSVLLSRKLEMEILFFAIGTSLIVLALVPTLKPLWKAIWELKSFHLFVFMLHIVGFILAIILLLGVFIFLG